MNTTTSATPLRIEDVSPDASALVLRVIDGWNPPKPVLGQLTNFTWGQKDMSGQVDEVRVNGDRLEVGWRDLEPALIHNSLHDELWGQAIEGTLSDGRNLKAEIACHTSNTTLVADHWTVSTPGHAARLWLGSVSGLYAEGGFLTAGNLTTVLKSVAKDGSPLSCGTSGHFRFRGAYTYYLFLRQREKKEWFLLLDTNDNTVPSRGTLYADMMALQFVLGRQFYVDLLHGIDGTKVVGFLGARHGQEGTSRSTVQPPIPLEFARVCWAADFFTLLSEAYRGRPQLRLYIALSFYLDALASSHVEGRYLALHIALESLAYWALHSNDIKEAPLVDSQKWRNWLKENKETIKSLATPGQEASLFTKITSIPKRRASSRVVEDAFRQYGLVLTEEMAGELEDGRGKIVHTAVMFDERQAQLEAYLAPIAIVRTMLVALVARVVGYDGPILGWTKQKNHMWSQIGLDWQTFVPASTSAAKNFRIGGETSQLPH